MIQLPGARPTQSAIADAVEIQVVFGDEPLSASTMLDWADEQLDTAEVEAFDRAFPDPDPDEPEPDEPELDRDEAKRTDEVLADDVVLELRDRERLVGEGYPLTIDEEVVRRKGDLRASQPYAFLMALSARYVYSLGSVSFHQAARLFERVVTESARGLLDPDGRSSHFGWPRSFDNLGQFPAAVKSLSGKLRERVIANLEKVDATKYKDYGLDAVAWVPMDERAGQLVMLIQCAVGEDWDKKGINPSAWSKVISFATDPITGLAFPFIPASLGSFGEEEYRLLAGIGGLWLDRLRLARIMSRTELPPELVDEIHGFTEEVIAALNKA